MWAQAPRRVYETTIPLTWGATDDTSGVARYDVQVRMEDGDWTAWLTGTLATSASYALGEGEWFTFRALQRIGKGTKADLLIRSKQCAVIRCFPNSL